MIGSIVLIAMDESFGNRLDRLSAGITEGVTRHHARAAIREIEQKENMLFTKKNVG